MIFYVGILIFITITLFVSIYLYIRNYLFKDELSVFYNRMDDFLFGKTYLDLKIATSLAKSKITT